ncbi:MAG TPA: DUF2442 domain-containing protein [Thermodesulfobacteriota bacterium]|nr:DUF2442 domain-containing protein [Thermodesulfobacteriota bacterium]
MKSKKLGKNTSNVDVINVSKHGFWMLVNGKEYFLPFKDFPWFREATISQLTNVRLVHPHHLYWSDLDVDLELESIEKPEVYPLIAKQ